MTDSSLVGQVNSYEETRSEGRIQRGAAFGVRLLHLRDTPGFIVKHYNSLAGVCLHITGRASRRCAAAADMRIIMAHARLFLSGKIYTLFHK